MAEIDYEFVEAKIASTPITALASKFGMEPIEFMGKVRKKGLIIEAQAFEVDFIANNKNRLPDEAIKKLLSMSDSHYRQILANKLRISSRKPSRLVTLSEALNKTKWLIEEKLKLGIDDFLPRSIARKDFINAKLYSIIKFAELEKTNDLYYRNFPAVAFLICKTYPNRFKPFQFRFSKTNEYFKGKSGKKNLIVAGRWVLENKLHLSDKNIDLVFSCNSFLRSRDLSFYGLGPTYWRHYFDSLASFVKTLISKDQVRKNYKRVSTNKLRKCLTKLGRDVGHCEVENCSFVGAHLIEIHHIIPVSDSHLVNFDINHPNNLTCLCPNHHKHASTFDWKPYSKNTGEKLRVSLVSWLSRTKY